MCVSNLAGQTSRVRCSMIQVTQTNRHKQAVRPRPTRACTVKHRPLFITTEPRVTPSVTKCFLKKQTTDPVLQLWTATGAWRQHQMLLCQSTQTTCTEEMWLLETDSSRRPMCHMMSLTAPIVLNLIRLNKTKNKTKHNTPNNVGIYLTGMKHIVRLFTLILILIIWVGLQLTNI